MELPKRKQNHLAEYDYSTPNAYFITVYTQNRKKYEYAEAGGRPMAAPTISRVISQTKGVISKKVSFPVSQKGFYGHVIRGERDYPDIWN